MRLYTDNNYKFKTSDESAYSYLHGCYFHGDAETILGHDLICTTDPSIFQEGIFDFEVIDSTYGHQIITGKIYMWTPELDSTFPRPRGLAVADDDVKGQEYAKHCFNKKQAAL